MDQNHHQLHHQPSHCDTDRFPGFEAWNTRGFVDVKKKRKLLIEELSLSTPTPKLPCWGRPRSTSCSFDQYEKDHNFKFKKNHPQEEEEEEEEIKSNIILRKMAIDKDKVEMQKISYGQEEDLLEFGSHGNSSLINIIDEGQCCSDSTSQSLLLPKEDSNNNHDFVLSSGRWTIHPETESKTIKLPTIDQEFEQYFSVLLP